MSAEINLTNPAKPKRVLMVIANPATSTTLGIPVGFWGAELAHAWNAFNEVGYEITVASPDGRKCEMDAWSDPRDESRYSFGDLITLGFINTPEYWSLVENTPALTEVEYDAFDAIVVVGGQSPMFTFREHEGLQQALRTFYEAEKVTAALCHGTAALIDCKALRRLVPDRGQDDDRLCERRGGVRRRVRGQEDDALAYRGCGQGTPR
jgi:putative intracellular protease/amidase